MTAKKVIKKKDPNLCVFVGGHSDGVGLVVSPTTVATHLPFVILKDDEFVHDEFWGDSWRVGFCPSDKELYVRLPKSNEFLCWEEYKDDPRLVWYRIEKLEKKCRLLLSDIDGLIHTKQTRWFHRK